MSAAVTSALTMAALVAFASNSILCRLALRSGAIDPASFTSLRLLSGAIVLAAMVWASRSGRETPSSGSWGSAAALAIYAIAFSWAYVSLSAGTGALLLFGAVQVTMIAVAIREGERAPWLEWAGLAVAVIGVVFLVSPGLAAPPPAGSALMIAAGIAWGVYSLRGRRAGSPVFATAANFLRAAPLALGVSAAMLVGREPVVISASGAGLALASGVLASGFGYVIWYAALRGLTALRAATVQLSVPVITAAGSIVLLGEALSLRFVVAAMLILGGVALALTVRR